MRIDSNKIQDIACERIREILSHFNIKYIETGGYLQCACPIHNGDNEKACYWSLTTNHFKCMTRHCETTQLTGKSKSVFGLVRGILASRHKKDITFKESLDYICKLLSIKKGYIEELDNESIEIEKIISNYERKKVVKNNQDMVPFKHYEHRLIKDTEYFLNRGISYDIISKYHISMTHTESNPFYNRSFFPIFDSTGEFVVGWSGRSIFDQCELCKLYHDKISNCPLENKYLYGKWRHSKGLKVEKYLYNHHFALPYIKKFKSAVICEGPGDVWSYEMAGIKNSVSIFGLNLSNEHRKLLLKAGARTIYINLDNDEAGINAAENIKKNLEDYFRTYIITTKGKDAGSMRPDEINSDIWPLIKDVAYVEKDK